MSCTKIPPEWALVIKRIPAAMEPDLTIICGEKEHHVHKLIMTSASTFFDKACNGRFKEGETNVVNLSDDDPVVVEATLAYLYQGTYDSVLENIFLSCIMGEDWFLQPLVSNEDRKREDYKDFSEMCKSDDWHTLIPFLAAVYELADKYDIRGLKETAEGRTAAILREFGNRWNEEMMQGILTLLAEAVQRVPGMHGVTGALASELLKKTTGGLDNDEILNFVILWPELCRMVIVGQRNSGKKSRR